MRRAKGSQPPADPTTRRHHVLGTASRARILEVLRWTPGGLDARETAMRVGLHHNTVRAHLELLVQAGLATRRAEERSVPGRPRVVFEATKDEAALEPSRYELLAKILTSYLAGSAKDPKAAATELGQAWGSYLTERRAPFDRISREEAVSRLLDQFAGLGFQPEMASDQEGAGMLLHRCPFREIAQAHPDVVCSIHLGLMRGALAEMGAPVGAVKLLPFVEPSLCVAYLEPTA